MAAPLLLWQSTIVGQELLSGEAAIPEWFKIIKNIMLPQQTSDDCGRHHDPVGSGEVHGHRDGGRESSRRVRGSPDLAYQPDEGHQARRVSPHWVARTCWWNELRPIHQRGARVRWARISKRR